jgi:hypothetical protein
MIGRILANLESARAYGMPTPAMKVNGEGSGMDAGEGMAPMAPGVIRRRDITRQMARGRRGFVTVIAIMLMALVGVAVAAVMMRVSTSARQGRAQREQAQVEQVLLAGMDLARSGAARAEGEMALPDELKREGARLRVVREGKGLALEATLGRLTLRAAMPGE